MGDMYNPQPAAAHQATVPSPRAQLSRAQSRRRRHPRSPERALSSPGRAVRGSPTLQVVSVTGAQVPYHAAGDKTARAVPAPAQVRVVEDTGDADALPPSLRHLGSRRSLTSALSTVQRTSSLSHLSVAPVPEDRELPGSPTWGAVDDDSVRLVPQPRSPTVPASVSTLSLPAPEWQPPPDPRRRTFRSQGSARRPQTAASTLSGFSGGLPSSRSRGLPRSGSGLPATPA